MIKHQRFLKHFGVALIAGFVMAGCASPSATVMIGQARAEIPVEQVQLYLEPPETYEKIAFIESSSKSSLSFSAQAQMDLVIERLKQEAAKVGANGVLLQETGEARSGSISTGTGGGTGGRNVSIGIGIGTTIGVTNKSGKGLAIYVIDAGTTEPVSSDDLATEQQQLEQDQP